MCLYNHSSFGSISVTEILKTYVYPEFDLHIIDNFVSELFPHIKNFNHILNDFLNTLQLYCSDL